MLRLLDARTGSYAEVRPTRPGLLRVCAHVPGVAEESDITGLRVLLLADLLARAAELRNLQVLTVLASDEHDPLAVRLALMSLPSHEPADLTDSAVVNARETVSLWRRRVAEWAELPSRPVPAHTAQTFRAAFDDLDTVSALALLRRLELDDGVSAGPKFEAFLYADRILGLGLPREIGRPRG
ncbi:MAG TPA: hypothetical protein VIY52_01035 [Streptosporangiaceae bacterium]